MRGRRHSNEGRAYCLAKPHSLATYLLSPQPFARQACRYSPHFAKQPDEPPSDFAQKPWHVLIRSEQLFASAGVAKASVSAAAAKPAHTSDGLRKFASIIPKQCGNAERMSAYLQSGLGVSVEATIPVIPAKAEI